MNIVISGDFGSGRTTLAKYIAENNGMTYYNAEDAYKEMANSAGLEAEQLRELSDISCLADRSVSDIVREYCTSHDNLVIDIREGFKLDPKAFSVYLSCDSRISASRLFTEDKDMDKYESLTQCFYDIQYRQHMSDEKILKRYGARISNADNFNVVLSSDLAAADILYSAIMFQIEEFGVEAKGNRISSLHPACYTEAYRAIMRKAKEDIDKLQGYPYLYDDRVLECVSKIKSVCDFNEVKEVPVYLCENDKWLFALSKHLGDDYPIFSTTKDEVADRLSEGYIILWRDTVLHIGR